MNEYKHSGKYILYQGEKNPILWSASREDAKTRYTVFGTVALSDNSRLIYDQYGLIRWEEGHPFTKYLRKP